MSHKRAPLRLDEDPNIALTLQVPASVHRSLHLYCLYRDHDERKIPKAAVAAIAAYLAADSDFKAWLRAHHEVVARVSSMAGPSTSRRPARGPASAASA